MTFKGKVGQNAQKQPSKTPNNILAKTGFSNVYDNVKNIPFVNGDEVNKDSFRIIPKSILEMGLSKTAIAVYVTLCCQADFVENKPFQISQANIGKLTGLSIPTTAKALNELEEHGLISRTKQITLTPKGAQNFYEENRQKAPHFSGGMNAVHR